jgi:ABC-2 type transport system ATP-binding protein
MEGKSTTLGIVLNVVNKTSGEYSWFNGLKLMSIKK